MQRLPTFPMLPDVADATADDGMDLDVYYAVAASDDAEDKEMMHRADTAKRVTENDYRRKWSPERRYAAGFLESIQFEIAMGALLLFNFIVVALESNSTAECVQETKNVNNCSRNANYTVINTVLLGVYCIEFGVKAAIWQRDLFRSNWNLFDGSIVFLSLIETIIQITGVSLPSMQFLRIFRLVRLGRTVRLLELFPELYFMVQGFASAVAAMWWGFVIIAVWIMAWSILAVELVNPANQSIPHDSEYCEAAFSSVYNAFLLFFQTLLAGDSWGACILPILQDAPYFGFIFVGAMVSIQLGFINLVLSCIVDAASKSHDANAKLQARVKKAQEIEAKDALVKMFVAMDRDNTGTITLEEFVQGYETDEKMRRQLAILHIGREDLDTVFGLIDEDNSGSLELGEFCRFIAGVQESDNRVSFMMLKTQVGRVLNKVETIHAAMENVAVVTGAAPVPTRFRRKSKLCKNRFGSPISMRRGSKSSLPRAARSVSGSSLSLAAGKQASATSTTQRDEAAKRGGEKEGATVDVQQAVTPCVVPAEALVIEASSLSFAQEKQASTASATRWDEAAAKGGGESEEATAVAPMAAMSKDIVSRTPRSSRGNSSGRFGRGIRKGDFPKKPTGDELVEAEDVEGTPRTPPENNIGEGSAPASASSTASRWRAAFSW